MPIDPSTVGHETEPTEASWTSNDALLYAVGVGAGNDELAYTTENTRGVDQQVLPTFGVVVTPPRAAGAGGLRAVGTFDLAMLVHGSQAIELHRPLPAEGTVLMRQRVAAIYDKGSAALVMLENEATDPVDGGLVFTTRMGAFIRGEGGFGGERGPSGARHVPPDREPDHTATYGTRADQALTYRLSGDHNPLHSDPAFAADAGFDRPILHGLCTYGFTGRALLHALCDGQSGRFRSMEGRFSSPVYPGDTLTVKMWRTGDGDAVYTTERVGYLADAPLVVIDQGRCTFD